MLLSISAVPPLGQHTAGTRPPARTFGVCAGAPCPALRAPCRAARVRPLTAAPGAAPRPSLPALPQRLHKLEVYINRGAEGKVGRAFVGEMSEEKAVQLASKVASEGFVYTVSCQWVCRWVGGWVGRLYLTICAGAGNRALCCGERRGRCAAFR